jgi:hypothetical protein
MTGRTFGVAEGVGSLLVSSLVVLLVLWLGLALLETRARRAPWWIPLSGLVTALLIAAAVLRPTLVTTRGTDLFPKVVVLLDRSWRLQLSAGDTTREELSQRALGDLKKQLKNTRLEVLGFGEGPANALARRRHH